MSRADATGSAPRGPLGESGRTGGHRDAWERLVRWQEAAEAGLRAASGHRWWVLWVVLAGLLANNLLFTVFVVALPSVAAGLHTSVATVTWLVTGPMLSYAVAAPLLGRVSDSWGHRRLYLAGMVGAIAVALASIWAPGAGFLIVARLLGGAVGAGVGASSMALVLVAFDRADRVKAMGWWSLVGAGGPVIGVAVGGPLIETFGWRSMFVMQVPLLVAATLVAAIVLPGKAPRSSIGPSAERGSDLPHGTVPEVPSGMARSGMDWPGAVVLTVSVGALLAGFNRAPELGWGSPLVLVMMAVALVGVPSFVLVEKRALSPLIPVAYMRDRNFAFPIGAQVFSNFAYMGGFFLAPLVFEQVFGYGEAAAGAMSIPRPLVYSLVAPAAGYLVGRIGERAGSIIGCTAVLASMVVFAITPAHGGILVVEAALVLSGIGLGISSPPLAAAVANAVHDHSLGMASAAQQLMTQVGVVAGIQVLQTLQASGAAARLHEHGPVLLGSFRQAFVVGGLVALAGVVCAALMRARQPPEMLRR